MTQNTKAAAENSFSIVAYGRARFEENRQLEVLVYRLHNQQQRKKHPFVGWIDPSHVSVRHYTSAYEAIFAQLSQANVGIYKHSKSGGLYELLGNITILDSQVEGLLLYRALYDSQQYGKEALWIRTADSFCEEVELDGRLVKRFELQDKEEKR